MARYLEGKATFWRVTMDNEGISETTAFSYDNFCQHWGSPEFRGLGETSKCKGLKYEE